MDNSPQQKSLPEFGPAPLNSEPRWVAWKAAPKPGGGFKKRPISAITGASKDFLNPENWTTFRQARDYAERHRLDGVGFVLGDGFCGVDLDDAFTTG